MASGVSTTGQDNRYTADAHDISRRFGASQGLDRDSASLQAHHLDEHHSLLIR